MLFFVYNMQLYGVSPAYFISAFTDGFTPDDVATGLTDLRSIGYDTFQMEIFHPDSLNVWIEGGGARVAEAARQNDLKISQFVAHMLLHGFSSAAAIHSTLGIRECGCIVEMLDAIEECPVVTIPLPEMAMNSDSQSTTSINAFEPVWQAAINKLTKMGRLIQASHRQMALEIMPGAFIAGSDGFLRVRSELAAAGIDVAYNFDTGHAWAQREPVWLLPSKLENHISGTHICDNDSLHNTSLRPGKGSIPWEGVFRGLFETGYTGSIDIEIICAPDAVQAEYTAALSYVKQFWNNEPHV